MVRECYMIWVDWKEQVVSFHEEAGFEALPFATEASWQANLSILITEGFRFQ